LKKKSAASARKAGFHSLVPDFHRVGAFGFVSDCAGCRKRCGWKTGGPSVILRPEKSINFIINTTKWPIPAKSPRLSDPSWT
jgi:hypothetical protein